MRTFLVLLSFLVLQACERDDHGGKSRDPAFGTGGSSRPISGWGRCSAGKETPDVASCHGGDEFACAVEAAILKGVNALRSAPIAERNRLSYVAREWSKEQAAAQQISHDGFPGARRAALEAEFGADAPGCVTAENVAMTWVREKNAAALGAELVDMWNDSPGHRANMLGDYPLIGIGVALTGNYAYATQIFGEE